jgi:hypothetical protein
MEGRNRPGHASMLRLRGSATAPAELSILVTNRPAPSQAGYREIPQSVARSRDSRVETRLPGVLPVPRDLPFYPMVGRKALASCFNDP